MIHFILEIARRFRYFLSRNKLDAELREEMDTDLTCWRKTPLPSRRRNGWAT